MSGAGRAPDGANAGLQRLQPYFDVSLVSASQDLRAVLQPIVDFKQILWRDDRQVTFFGAFKAGKSTLLNTIVGAPLLPARANRATGAITKIRYGAEPSASIMRRTSDGEPREEVVHFDDVARYILLDLSETRSHAPLVVDEVLISVPLSFLQSRCTLVDTPGLLDDEALSERGFQELERSDLAVMILSADKILSGHERDAAGAAADLLNGNLVFIVNRLNLVDQEDREEVLAWAELALQGLGNAIVGRPRIFATGTKGPAEGKQRPAVDGLSQFERWLEGLLNSPAGDTMAVLSRLGILEHRLTGAAAALERQFAQAKAVAEQLSEEETDTLERERVLMRSSIAQDRRRVSAVRGELANIGETFVQECLQRTELRMKSDAERAGPLRVCFDSALHTFETEIFEAAQSAVTDSRLPIPRFDLDRLILSAEVSPFRDSAKDLGAELGSLVTRILDGGSAGREAGASLGAWLGEHLFRVEPERETLKAVERVAGAVVPQLTAEAEAYLNRVERLLTDADEYYEKWMRFSPRVDAARQTESYFQGLVTWCSEFLREVRNITNELADVPPQ